MYRPIVVGSCGDPGIISTDTGATPGNRCPSTLIGCGEKDARSWAAAAASLRQSILNSWDVLLKVEYENKTTSEQSKLSKRRWEVMQTYKVLPKVQDIDDFWRTEKLSAMISKIVAWMVTASCLLGEIDRSIRLYDEKPPTHVRPAEESGTQVEPDDLPSIPSGGGGSIYNRPASSVGGGASKLATNLVLLSVIGGIGYYLLNSGSLSMLGRAPSSPRVKLPPSR